MQSRDFFTDLRFILTIFKHKYLKISDTHEAQITFRMFCYEKRTFFRKEKVSSFILTQILVKCGNEQNHPAKIDSLFTWKRSYRFFLISPASCPD